MSEIESTFQMPLEYASDPNWIAYYRRRLFYGQDVPGLQDGVWTVPTATVNVLDLSWTADAPSGEIPINPIGYEVVKNEEISEIQLQKDSNTPGRDDMSITNLSTSRSSQQAGYIDSYGVADPGSDDVRYDIPDIGIDSGISTTAGSVVINQPSQMTSILGGLILGLTFLMGLSKRR